MANYVEQDGYRGYTSVGLGGLRCRAVLAQAKEEDEASWNLAFRSYLSGFVSAINRERPNRSYFMPRTLEVFEKMVYETCASYPQDNLDDVINYNLLSKD